MSALTIALISILGIVVPAIINYLNTRNIRSSKKDHNVLQYLHSQMITKDKKIELLLSKVANLQDNLSEQRRLVALIESQDWDIPCPYWLKSRVFTVEYVNKYYLSEFDLEYVDVIGKSDYEVWDEDTANSFRKSDEEILNGKDVIRVYVSSEKKNYIVVKWKRFTGNTVIGIGGLAISMNDIDKNTLTNFMKDE